MLEKQVEQYLTNRVKKVGGYSYKWSSPANRGVPDRVVFVYGEVWFIEVKRPGGKLTPLQIALGSIILKFTKNYAVLHSKEEVKAWLSVISPDPIK
jgi:hypothetical protein